jgi:hypothetical protein
LNSPEAQALSNFCSSTYRRIDDRRHAIPARWNMGATAGAIQDDGIGALADGDVGRHPAGSRLHSVGDAMGAAVIFWR